MRSRSSALCLLLTLFAGCGGETTAPPDFLSDFTWPEATPQAQGVDGTLLDSADLWIRDSLINVNALLVVKNGSIVYERYYFQHHVSAATEVHSVTKSFVGAFVGIALRQGWIESIDVTLPQLFPEVFEELGDTLDPRKRQIRVRDLLTMSSGIDFERTTNLPFDRGDRVRAIIGAPLAHDPGTAFLYDGGNPQLLSAAITARTGMALADLGREHLFGPLNISTGRWIVDPDGNNNGGTGIFMTARDMAKLGQLYLQDGVWEGERLLAEGWVGQSSLPQFVLEPGSFANYGFQWWTSTQLFGTPALMAAGYRGQWVIVLPALDAVVVIKSESANPRSSVFEYLHIMPRFVLPALGAD